MTYLLNDANTELYQAMDDYLNVAEARTMELKTEEAFNYQTHFIQQSNRMDLFLTRLELAQTIAQHLIEEKSKSPVIEKSTTVLPVNQITLNSHSPILPTKESTDYSQIEFDLDDSQYQNKPSLFSNLWGWGAKKYTDAKDTVTTLFHTKDDEEEFDVNASVPKEEFDVNASVPEENKKPEPILPVKITTTGHERLDKQLQQLPVESLEQFVQECELINTSMMQGYELWTRILSEKKALEEMNDAQESIAAFLAVHNDIWVAISNFFAFFWSIFKSDRATLVDKVLEMQNETTTLQQRYCDELNKNVNLLNEESNPLLTKNTLTKTNDIQLFTIPSPIDEQKKQSEVNNETALGFFTLINNAHKERMTKALIHEDEGALTQLNIL